MEPALLIYGDTERNAALRHELPIAIGDPFLFGVVEGRPHVMASALERERIAAAVPRPSCTTSATSASTSCSTATAPATM